MKQRRAVCISLLGLKALIMAILFVLLAAHVPLIMTLLQQTNFRGQGKTLPFRTQRKKTNWISFSPTLLSSFRRGLLPYQGGRKPGRIKWELWHCFEWSLPTCSKVGWYLIRIPLTKLPSETPLEDICESTCVYKRIGDSDPTNEYCFVPMQSGVAECLVRILILYKHAPDETRSDDTRPKQTRAALSQKCKLQFQALPTQSPETTAAGTSVSLIDLIRERELIEESIKDLNNEERDAVEINTELDKVLEKIKNLISTSRTPHEST